jgi:hypothetical protein
MYTVLSDTGRRTTAQGNTVPLCVGIERRLVRTNFATSLTRHRLPVPLHVGLIHGPPGKGFATLLALKLALLSQPEIRVVLCSMPPICGIGIELLAAVFAWKTVPLLLLSVSFQCFLFPFVAAALFGGIRPEVDPDVFRFSVHFLLLFQLILFVFGGRVFVVSGFRGLLRSGIL